MSDDRRRWYEGRGLLVAVALVLAPGCSATPAPQRAVSSGSGSPLAAPASSSQRASGAGGATPTSSAAPAPPDVEHDIGQWEARLRELYAALSGGAPRVRAAYASLLAARLERFIGLREVSRERAIDAAWQFLSSKAARRYDLAGPPRVKREHAGRSSILATVRARWEVAVEPSWVEVVPELAELVLTTQNELEVELQADEAGRVTSYAERRAPARGLRVAVATRGYDVPFVEGCWAAPPEEPNGIALPVGTALEPTGTFIEVFDCGPPTRLELVRLRGKSWWVLMALYERVPNPEGGTSLGGVDYLEYAPP